MKTDRRKTITSIVRLIWGRALRKSAPTPYGRLAHPEREALLMPYEDEIEKDVDTLMEIVRLAQESGAAQVYQHIRKADALDPEAIDEIMESSLELGDNPVRID